MDRAHREQVELKNGLSLSDHLASFIREKWIVLFAIILGLYAGLPFLAPIFYHIGWTAPGQAIQAVYSTQCHQLPDRSFFLFGQKIMYSMSEIQQAWKDTTDPNVLRQFVGNQQMGWKVAWSDRMVAMYTSIFFLGLLWWPFRKKVPFLPLWGLVLFWLPMGVDGATHMLSDILGGVGAGFRYSNDWLAFLTGHLLPGWFYAGDALGSFNSSMRILSGFLFGVGTVWYVLPILDLAGRVEENTSRATRKM